MASSLPRLDATVHFQGLQTVPSVSLFKRLLQHLWRVGEGMEESLLRQLTTLPCKPEHGMGSFVNKAPTVRRIHYDLFLDEHDAGLNCVKMFIRGLKPVS